MPATKKKPGVDRSGKTQDNHKPEPEVLLDIASAEMFASMPKVPEPDRFVIETYNTYKRFADDIRKGPLSREGYATVLTIAAMKRDRV